MAEESGVRSSSTWPRRDSASGCFVPQERDGAKRVLSQSWNGFEHAGPASKEQSGEQRLSENSMAGESRLIAVELAAMSASAATGNSVAPLRCCCPTAGKWRVGSGFDAETLVEL